MARNGGLQLKTTSVIENIEGVWKSYFETHEEQYRNLLMENYLRLVKYTAERIYDYLDFIDSGEGTGYGAVIWGVEIDLDESTAQGLSR